MEREDLTRQIIGYAYRVYNTMGYGYLESVYKKCLIIELKRAGLSCEEEKQITVTYEGEVVGHFVADLLVADSAIIELKSVRQLVRAHEVQLVNYLVATHKQIGLLINFGPTQVDIKRKLRELPKESSVIVS